MRQKISLWWIGSLLVVISLVLGACATQPASTPAEPAAATAETTEGDTPSDTDEDADTDADTDTDADADTTADEGTEDATDAEAFVLGMVLVGPYNDAGWSQAHYEGGLYVEEHVPGTKFVYIDKVNPADRPNYTVEQAVDDLVAQNAQLIITNSDEFKDGTRQAATLYPEVAFVHISGDDVLTDMAPDNLGNIMGRMVHGKMIAGCAAALQSETGRISYLGPLINEETRRLVNASYLGARYCTDNLRDSKFPDGLSFNVVWIGYWFNIPGVTLDPTQVANDFINNGSDVLISGLDTTEALVEANKASEAGEEVYAIPYDYLAACEQAPDVCLGVPYFNWGPIYVEQVQAVRDGTWEQEWLWLEPDWDDINNLETSAIGFLKGEGLNEAAQEKLDTFIEGLASGEIQLFEGPLNFQDGSVFLEEGEVATNEQIWYTPQLLEGIEGQSAEE